MSVLSNLLWVDGSHADRLEDDVDPASLYGHYSLAQSEGPRHLLARDPLGVHKLFFAFDDAGRLDSDPFLYALAQRHPAERIFSVPSQSLLEVDWEARTLTRKPYPELTFGEAGSTEEAAAGIRRALELAFERLVDASGEAPIYLTLSGGLDSSTIATFAASHFPKGRVTALTLHVDDGRPVEEGTDLHAARAVAKQLGLPLRELVVKPSLIAELLDVALVYGQDFRDFNVHCALVNAAIARELSPEPGAFVLTGDGANELMSDYEAVELDGRSYYDLPRLSRSALRRFLVRGLDAGDREVGVFAHYGMRCAQPFLLAARAFAAVPDALVDDRHAKSQLARILLEDRIPEMIYHRPKVRAQCGREGTPSGTMATLLEAGIDQHVLTERFATLYGFDAAYVRGLIRAGMYRNPQRFEQLSCKPS